MNPAKCCSFWTDWKNFASRWISQMPHPLATLVVKFPCRISLRILYEVTCCQGQHSGFCQSLELVRSSSRIGRPCDGSPASYPNAIKDYINHCITNTLDEYSISQDSSQSQTNTPEDVSSQVWTYLNSQKLLLILSSVACGLPHYRNYAIAPF